TASRSSSSPRAVRGSGASTRAAVRPEPPACGESLPVFGARIVERFSPALRHARAELTAHVRTGSGDAAHVDSPATVLMARFAYATCEPSAEMTGQAATSPSGSRPLIGTVTRTVLGAARSCTETWLIRPPRFDLDDNASLVEGRRPDLTRRSARPERTVWRPRWRRTRHPSRRR